jgi:hypothetical protein
MLNDRPPGRPAFPIASRSQSALHPDRAHPEAERRYGDFPPIRAATPARSQRRGHLEAPPPVAGAFMGDSFHERDRIAARECPPPAPESQSI